MQKILYPPSRPQGVGEVLDSAFRIFGATLLKCLPYATLGVIAGQIPTLYDLSRGRSLTQPNFLNHLNDPLWVVLYIAAILISIVLTSAVIMRQYALVSGRPAAARTELARSVRRVPGMILIGILIGLSVLPAGAAAAMARGAGANITALAGFALLIVVLLIPASWLLLRWSCAWTVYLLTDRSPVASMSHSWQLTAGSFWRLSLIYTIAVVLIAVLYVLSGIVGGILALLFARGDVAVFTAATTVVVVLLGAVATPFYWGLALAVLGDLSVRREGADLAQRMAASSASQ
jgi:hypothetical protein